MLKYEKVLSSEDASFTCYLRGEQRFPFEWHYHPEYELIAVTASRGRRFVGDNVADYGPGDIVLLGPDLPHSWQSIYDSEYHQESVVVQFSYGFLGDTLFDHGEFQAVRQMLEDSGRGLAFSGEKAEVLTERLKSLIKLEGLGRVLELLSILDELTRVDDIQTLSSEGFDATCNKPETERINKAFNYMHKQMSEVFHQHDVADYLNMSRSGFSRFFRRCTGQSFIRCLNDMRVGQACRYLIDTDMTITEICFKSGFRNLSNFNRQFLSRHDRGSVGFGNIYARKNARGIEYDGHCATG